jgi:hypothetical protein
MPYTTPKAFIPFGRLAYILGSISWPPLAMQKKQTKKPVK